MAAGIGCDLCNEEMAVALQTNLGNGEVLGIGGSCLLTFYVSSALEMARQVESDQGQAVAPMVAELAAVPSLGLTLVDGSDPVVALAISQAADAAAAPDKPARKPRGARAKAGVAAHADRGEAASGAQARPDGAQADADGGPVPF